jgi:hypothetical protein
VSLHPQPRNLRLADLDHGLGITFRDRLVPVWVVRVQAARATLLGLRLGPEVERRVQAYLDCAGFVTDAAFMIDSAPWQVRVAVRSLLTAMWRRDHGETWQRGEGWPQDVEVPTLAHEEAA